MGLPINCFEQIRFVLIGKHPLFGLFYGYFLSDIGLPQNLRFLSDTKSISHFFYGIWWGMLGCVFEWWVLCEFLLSSVYLGNSLVIFLSVVLSESVFVVVGIDVGFIGCVFVLIIRHTITLIVNIKLIESIIVQFLQKIKYPSFYSTTPKFICQKASYNSSLINIKGISCLFLGCSWRPSLKGVFRIYLSSNKAFKLYLYILIYVMYLECYIIALKRLEVLGEICYCHSEQMPNRGDTGSPTWLICWMFHFDDFWASSLNFTVISKLSREEILGQKFLYDWVFGCSICAGNN